MKEEIRTKTKSKIDDETKQLLIKQGKEQADERFKNMFGKTQLNLCLHIMTFLKITDLAKRDLLVQKLIKTCKNITQ